MTGIDVLQQPLAQAVGWALLHFVWQGALIAALTATALVLLQRSAADVRYVVAAAAMSLMLTMPIVTAVQTWNAARETAARSPAVAPAVEFAGGHREVPVAPIADGTAAGAAVLTAAPRSASMASLFDRIRLEPWLPVMVLAWFCGVALLTMRLLSGWLWVQRMKSHGATPAADGWQVMAARLARRLHIRRHVRLLDSPLVDVPTVIGWLKPVVLMPASAVAGLTPLQLEAILAHELAHVRRHDYLVNLLQTLVETLLFYHPAVWWLSRRIRMERENCCDDLAVSLCGDPYTYATALADLEELRAPGGRLVMAANGGSLLQRVRRLVGAPTHAGHEPGWLAGSAAVLVMLAIAAGVVTTEPHAAAASAAVASQGEAPDPADVMDWTDASGQDLPPVPPRPPAPPAAPQPPAVPEAPAAPPAMDPQGAPPAPPEPPQPPSPPAPPTPPSGQARNGTFTWSHNGEKLEIKYSGDLELTDDDADVKRLSPGGYLRISEGGWFGSQGVEFRADASGNLTRRYWKGSSERPFEPEGRQWLAAKLPRFIRQSGIGAPARVARILKAKGPDGVLAEISLIEGGYAKRIYFAELIRTANLDAATSRRVLDQAGREVESDYELASLLISSDKLLVDDAARKAYFDAARTIESDYEMRRVYSSALKKGPVAPALLAGLLDASRDISSDYEAASLLVEVATLQPLDGTTRAPFFAALDTVGSDYEKRRVLTAIGSRADMPAEQVADMLKSGASVSSDYEAATFLLQIAGKRPIEGAVRAPFFSAVDGISSNYERGRVLQGVLRRPDTSNDTLLAVLRAVRPMKGSYEASRVLQAAAAAHTLTGEARDLYIEVAEALGDYEQGRALSALVKSERRK